MTTLLQDSTSENPRFAIVVSSFNSDITDALLAGAKGAFSAAGLPAEALAIHHVPGAFELPFVCDQLAASGTFAAVLALGCVIRGDTPHFDFVASQCAKGIEESARHRGVPIIFGVLTTDTFAQAKHRASPHSLQGSDAIAQDRQVKVTPESNKGAEAALTAISMAKVMETLA